MQCSLSKNHIKKICLLAIKAATPCYQQQDNTPADTRELAFLPNDVPESTMLKSRMKETKDGECAPLFYSLAQTVFQLIFVIDQIFGTQFTKCFLKINDDSFKVSKNYKKFETWD